MTMTKKKLTEMLKWIESEDYQDFSDNFTTLKRRVDYLYRKYIVEKEKEKKESSRRV